jgi:hypothetical protein
LFRVGLLLDCGPIPPHPIRHPQFPIHPGFLWSLRWLSLRQNRLAATTPAGQAIIELQPDTANHIHVRVVLEQRINNQVARICDPP